MKNLLKFFFIFGRRNQQPKENNKEYPEPANFETAIEAAEFGKFNILLLLIAIPTCWANLFQTTTMSYVFPAAQCNLELSLEDKGLLNAITYLGTCVSSFLWGFIFDTFGRRKPLLIAYLLDGLIVILSGVSQNLTFLMVTKFFGGFMISGPFAALTTYFSELHIAKYRSRIPLIMGVVYAVGGVYLPFVASLILPINLKFNINNNLVFHSWGLFLFASALPSLIGGIIFFFLPETPKFLMSMGKNDEALEVFRKIYSINSGKPKDQYPIKTLLVENEAENQEAKNAFKRGWKQIRPLFGSLFLKIFILVCSLQFLVTMSFNTFRLWLPQLFQAINDFKALNNGTSSNICVMMNVLQNEHAPEDCFVNFDNFEVYLNAMTVCIASVIGYLIAAGLVNILGQNRLFTFTCFIAGSFAVGIYFSPNSLLTTVSMSGWYSLNSIATNAVLIVIVNLFPTTLRATAISLTLVFGRAGSILGNIVFPHLIKMGCAQPFFATASLVFLSSGLALLLPKENKHFV